jgi:hypothetical protein
MNNRHPERDQARAQLLHEQSLNTLEYLIRKRDRLRAAGRDAVSAQDLDDAVHAVDVQATVCMLAALDMDQIPVLPEPAALPMPPALPGQVPAAAPGFLAASESDQFPPPP